MIEIRNLCKAYRAGGLVQQALDNISITFRDSEFVAVLGPSGSGKTTFLNILGGFDHADSGEILVNGASTAQYGDAQWDSYRNHRVGFVFQSYNLIPHQTVLANVEIALTLAGVDKGERRARARAALERVGLGAHVDKLPAQLSGGQMQRVAIARALVNDPQIVLADEPTGALDTETGIQVMDLLAEVARERLVIMVTHNPQLAADYADRIVRIKDGRLVDDTNPVDDASSAERAAAQHEGENDGASSKRSSMGFLTALSLSFNNLMTKKGRTIMTAFAGSIGIMGIAAILALSNGVNSYIAKVEQDTLSSYPLTIARQSYDLSGLMGSGAPAGETPASSKPSSSDSIGVFTMLSDMFASVKSNDMTHFKQFLDAGGEGISNEVSAISYDYGVAPIVYRAATDAGPVQLSPNAMTRAMSGGASTGAMAGAGMSNMSAFTEMLDNPELLEEQYDVVEGRWAKAPDECVLVLSKSGKVSDYTLYSMGVLDPAQLNRMVDATMNGTGAVEVPPVDTKFTYRDALDTRFKVLAPSDAYRPNPETGGWTDMSSDSEFMAGQVQHGLDLKVVGVVKPSPTAKSAALSQGIAYTHGLTEALIERVRSSTIAQQQVAHPEIDVFTGKSFATLQEEAKREVDLANLFSVDEAALRQAFSIDASVLAEGLDLGSEAFSGLDAGGVHIDMEDMLSQVDFSSLLGRAPAPDFKEAFDGLVNDPPVAAPDAARALELAGAFAQRFTTVWLPAHGGHLDPGSPDFPAHLLDEFRAYATSSDEEGGAVALKQIEELAGAPLAKRVRDLAETYVEHDLAPYFAHALNAVTQDVVDRMSGELAAQLQQILANGMQGAAQRIAPQLARNMQRALSVDGSAFARAIHFNMDADDLASLMTSYAQAGSLTYDANLMRLGYADLDDPQAVLMYPVDFEAKQRVLDSIDTYNQRVKAEGHDERAIVYTDYMGVLMGSVTSIVHMISLVLIAFVSISLVVSSIMIGIITYISVLERKKEIGILRAMGASKRNVANVFNAETCIEGLIAGVLAIVVVVLVSIPVNAWALSTYQVEGVMRLPVASALGLIAISVLLTVVAGLIPSRSAARRDPVEALRSE